MIFGHFCICSISAQSNFAVGAVVNATFGSITELTFYITALLRGHKAANPCLQEVVKAALTGTLLGCILFIPVSQQKNLICTSNCKLTMCMTTYIQCACLLAKQTKNIVLYMTSTHIHQRASQGKY